MSKDYKRKRLIDELTLTGLELAPAQVFGGVRLVPLLRAQHREDLRLARRVFGDNVGLVSLPDDTVYSSYIPHGLVATWNPEGGAIFGTRAITPKDRQKPKHNEIIRNDTATKLYKMARRESATTLRFLPQHTAMEGFLALHFGGPDLAWSEYSRSAISHGLGSRYELSVPGRYIDGLEDALRVFEMHSNQIGLLLFVADTLAAAFIVPHPADYRALHKTLITDFYGDLLFYYGMYATDIGVEVPSVDEERIHSFEDLKREVRRIHDDWSQFHTDQVGALFSTAITAANVYDFHDFSLQRFSTGFNPDAENHIGEVIVDRSNTIQYLKTYRLSAAQCKRAYLLSQLAEHGWNLDDCASTLNCGREALILRLQNAGFGYLLHQHVLDAATAWERRRGV